MTEEIRKQLNREIRAYFVENIEHFEKRADLAYDRMADLRAPLYHIDNSLHEEMQEKLEEWIEGNLVYDLEDLLCEDSQ